jgi:shikimate kinase
MGNRIITISREFGSGGRTIGKQLANKLSIPCYDAELIEQIATGIPSRMICGKLSVTSFLSLLVRSPV